jgi:quinoprotein glucose dehydrogenase
MPAFSDLDNTTLNAILTFLGNAGGTATSAAKSAMVVASGGAPGGLDLRVPTGPRYSQLGGPPYPEGFDTPHDRYYTRWGLYPDQPFVISPPWSSVVAYDLNKGTIKWKVPFGQDAKAAEEGATDTGAFMAEHHGMIVTATGLIFIAASDGKLRAYDEETGKTLWTVTLPSSSEGIPAMYEVNGRQFLVISASSNPNTAGRGRTAATGPSQMKGYIAFALPERSSTRGCRKCAIAAASARGQNCRMKQPELERRFQATIAFTTRPSTSVNRKSRPLKRNVSFS